MKSNKKKVLFISSTGGHLSELMRLSPMFDKYEYFIITEKKVHALIAENPIIPYFVERNVLIKLVMVTC